MPREKFTRRFSAELVTRALHMLDIPARVNDRHDIMIGDRKASIVTKGVESVRSPVTKLNKYSLTVDHQAFCQAVADEFSRTYNLATKSPPVYLDDTVIESIPQIVAYRDKLQAIESQRHSLSWEWLYGQTPEFTNTLHFDAGWGAMGIVIKARHGIIQQATFSVEQKGGDQLGIWAQLSTALQGIRYNPKDLRVALTRLIHSLPLSEARGRSQLLDTLAYLESRL
ncbi:hypothetical protein H4R35_004856 [Dimargaris xerosporica]|nr:hypothetical protein H4R35_004856 [Dimargaris xerosporica]